jgi:hypothetical protein
MHRCLDVSALLKGSNGAVGGAATGTNAGTVKASRRDRRGGKSITNADANSSTEVLAEDEKQREIGDDNDNDDEDGDIIAVRDDDKIKAESRNKAKGKNKDKVIDNDTDVNTNKSKDKTNYKDTSKFKEGKVKGKIIGNGKGKDKGKGNEPFVLRRQVEKHADLSSTGLLLYFTFEESLSASHVSDITQQVWICA